MSNETTDRHRDEPGHDGVPSVPPTDGPAPTPATPGEPPRPTPPRPGPRPGAGPGAVPAAPIAARPAPDSGSGSGSFGRVDASGAVWLRTSDGERQIGSWQAGEPGEGLAHFRRRFDDLATEIELLERRLATGAGEPRQTQDTARALLTSLPEAAVIGDVEALASRLEQVLAATDGAVAAAKEEKARVRAAQAARKVALADEATTIAAEATQWKSAGDRLHEILDEWKTIRGVDRRTDEALWKRYSAARETFNRRRGGHFAELDRERGQARSAKEELVAEAERLADSTEFGPTAARFRDLMTRWKGAGRASRDVDDALWLRFKSAQDRFFAARNAVTSERDAEFVANGEAKAALLMEAESIDPESDLGRAKAALRSIQERWDAIGMVPRAAMASLEARMRAVEAKVKGADDARWSRTDPETQARAAQFSERVRQFEEQAAKARAGGDERRAVQAEVQAAQWREWATAAEGAVGGR